MKIDLMNVKRQHERHAKQYENAVLRVLRSGRYIGGEEVTQFEKEFAAYEGAKYGVSCGNGTDALVLALRALKIGDGDEVITVSWTFFATAESIAAVGAKPVFIDVDPSTYCMNPSLIEKAITKKTKAVIPVHFYGQSCDMDAIRSVCSRYGLYLITDCAQSAGTEYHGERKNILGDISCFSFFPTKNLGCDGDGGIVLTDDEEIANTVRSLKAHGSGKYGLKALKEIYEKKNLQLPDNIPVGETKYYNYLIGYNSRLDAIQAALLKEKLKHLDEFVDERRKNAAFYNKALMDSKVITPFESSNGKHSFYIYALKHPKAQMIISELEKNGIASGTYYPVPLHLQGAFAYLGYKKGDLPVTEDLCKTTFVLPVFPEITDEEKAFVVKTLMRILAEED